MIRRAFLSSLGVLASLAAWPWRKRLVAKVTHRQLDELHCELTRRFRSGENVRGPSQALVCGICGRPAAFVVNSYAVGLEIEVCSHVARGIRELADSCQRKLGENPFPNGELYLRGLRVQESIA